MCLDFPASLSEPHLMLKLLTAGLFWDSHWPTPPSSDDSDQEMKPRPPPVPVPGDVQVMVSATPPPPMVCPRGVTPERVSMDQQLRTNHGYGDGLGLVRGCTAGRKNSWVLQLPF